MSSSIRLSAVALATALCVIAAALLALTLPRQAEAQTSPVPTAQLTQVTDFGANPGNLEMYLYVPDNVLAEAPLLVGVHWCTGSGPDFYNGTEYARLAEQHGFIVLYPSVTRSSKCFDVASPQALTRDGGSDPVSIKSMIDWVESNYTIDEDRVFATGVSSGAMMTNVLLGLYPDVFEAGSAFAGVPFGCFATTNGSEWNSECAGGQIVRTPQQWGDLVRGAYPGYSGERPRMQTWHGTEDDTLRYPNFDEQIKQWTNVHGVSRTPSFNDRPQSNWNRTRYGGTGSQAPVEAISVEGVGHNVITAQMAPYVMDFFGLDDPVEEPTDPITDEPSEPAEGGCEATVEVAGDWGSGWQGSVSVTAGSESIDGWTLTWTWPGGQRITSSWNADLTANGSSVTVSDVGWNGNVAAGQARSASGFIATGPSASPEVTCTPA
ncbi:CE1 family esterase [Glycomyces tarimensis]